jgi:transcriptional regulator with XRE-family HTH domain
MNTSVFEILRDGRHKARLTAQKVKDTLGISRNYLCKMENSKEIPSVSLIVKLSELYGLKITEAEATKLYKAAHEEKNKNTLSSTEWKIITAWRERNVQKLAKFVSLAAQHN